MKNATEEKEDLYALVFTELKNFGVKVPKVKKFKSYIAKQDRSLTENRNKVFGTSLSEQEWISECGGPLPKFIAATTMYLRNYVDVEIGLFRKAGSVARQRDLRAKIEKDIVLENCEPNDVASLLKQWLRELPEPVIPIYLHDLFLRCYSLESEEDRVAAVLMCCLLLPSEHLYTLKHLLKFLSDIASNSDVNKMVPHNLAVVMAPNLLSCGCDKVDKSSSSRVQCYTSLVELLIINADLVGQVPSKLASHLSLKPGDDHNFPIESLDFSPSKLRSKKRRSGGGVTDLVNGIRKFVGSNLTPINNCMDNTIENKDPAPRSAPKRKADPDHTSLDIKKKLINETQSVIIGQSPMFTPIGKSRFIHSFATPVVAPNLNTPLSHIRRKSFGLLGKKKRKRAKATSKSVSNGKEISPMLGVCKLPEDCLTACVGTDSQNAPVTKKSLLTVPVVELSPAVNLNESGSPSLRRKPRIVRANSDQPLASERDVITRALSTSHECLHPKKAIAVRVNGRSRNGRSQVWDPVQLRTKAAPKRRSPKADNNLLAPPPPVSTTVPEKPEALVCPDKPRIRRTGSARRSTRRKVTKLARSSSDTLSKPKDSDLVDGPKPLGHEGSSAFDGNATSTNKDEHVEVNPVLNTPDAKRSSLRRGGTKSSLRRGRPNTIKTGLPSELCPKYSSDTASLKLNLSDVLASPEGTESLQASEKKDELPEGASVIPNSIEKKKRSTRKRSSTGSEMAQLVEAESEESSDNVKYQSRPSLTATEQKTKDPSSLRAVPDLPSLDDFPQFTHMKSRRSSTSANILTPAKIEEEVPEDDLHASIPVMSFNMSSNPEKEKISDSEEWNDAEDFLSTNLLQANVPSCKRESIVQIMIKNAGKVQANVHLYNRIAKTTPPSSSGPVSAPNTAVLRTTSLPNHATSLERRNTPRQRTPCSSQGKGSRSKLTRSESRSAKYKPPLPPPPKFFATSMENVSSPLKEVTNLNNSRDLRAVSSMSPVDKLKASPLLPQRKMELQKTETPNAMGFDKARRSESSPALSQARCRRIVTDENSPSPTPKALPAHSQSFNSSYKSHRRAPKPTMHIVETPSFNELVDEWQCDL